MIVKLCWGLLLAMAAWAGPAFGQARGDDVLLEMGQAFKSGDRKKLAQLLPQAKGHPLEGWAAYWELRARLEEASPQEVQDFIARFAGSYLEDRLRNDWLLLLGQRRDWDAFATEHPNYRMGDDREVRCYLLTIELLKKGPAAPAALSDEVRRNWYAQRDDDGCTLAAGRLFDAKKMPAQDIWKKARLSVDALRLRAARNAVELIAPEVLPQVGDLYANPAKFLAAHATATGKVRKELVLLALIRMAGNDPDVAATALDSKWSVHLLPEERNWAWGVIGKQAALKQGSPALEYFAKVEKDSDLTSEMLAWKARAALRAGSRPQWPVVLEAIQAMDDDTRKDPTWIYWKARALQALATDARPAGRAEATALLEGIASVRGFYEQLALEELGRQVSVPARPQPPTPEEKALVRQIPGLNRALYAIAIGLRAEGVREWNYHTNLVNPRGQPGAMNDRELLAAAQLACERAVWDRCINTSERTRGDIDFETRFPTPHREAVVKRTREIGLDPAYVYGLIRQESRFVTDARSGVGASGLMQVMPATARWTAKKLGLVGFTADQITDRDTNIAIGTGYLKLVLDDFAGSLPMAAAAYNAGPGRPRIWRGQPGAPVLEAAIWAENVPFAETRDYVKKVLANTTSYAALLTGQPQSLKARLGTVGPRDASAPDVNRELP